MKIKSNCTRFKKLIICVLHLCCNKTVVNSFKVQQLLMSSLLCYAPVMDHCYDVSVLHSGQSMCNDDSCATLTSCIQSLLHNLQVYRTKTSIKSNQWCQKLDTMTKTTCSCVLSCLLILGETCNQGWQEAIREWHSECLLGKRSLSQTSKPPWNLFLKNKDLKAKTPKQKSWLNPFSWKIKMYLTPKHHLRIVRRMICSAAWPSHSLCLGQR